MRTLIVFLCAIAMMGCTQREKAQSNRPATTLARRVEAFKGIGPSMGLKEVEARFGPPDFDAGSGIYVYVYGLADGSEVRIGADSPDQIKYVYHGTNVLFKLPSHP
jgi:hypothetical protein